MKIQSLKKLQSGGNITRKQARLASYDNFGYQPGAGHFDTAYTNVKNALRENGLRGKELRQAARSWFVNPSNSSSNSPSQVRDIANYDLTVSKPLNLNSRDKLKYNQNNLVGFNDYMSENNIANGRSAYLNNLSFNEAFKFVNDLKENIPRYKYANRFLWRPGTNPYNPSGIYSLKKAKTRDEWLMNRFKEYDETDPKFNEIVEEMEQRGLISEEPVVSTAVPELPIIEEPVIEGLPDNYITEDMLVDNIPSAGINTPQYNTNTNKFNFNVNPSDYNFITPLPGKNYSKKNKRFWDTTAGYLTSQLIPGYGQYRATKAAINDIKTNPNTREAIKSVLIPGYGAVTGIKNLFRK